jgi:hypothetical protein
MALVEFRAGDAGALAARAVGAGSGMLDAPGPRDKHRRPWRRRYRHDRHLRDLLTGPQRLVLLGLVLVWGLCAAWAIRWWVEPDHWTSTTAMILNSIPLGIEFVVLPAWLYTWLWRMKRPDPALCVRGCGRRSS